MSRDLALVQTPDAGQIENVLVKGDLAQLSETQRVSYYNALCKSLGLNPLTQPFQYLTLQGKLILYARRDATEQLRKIHSVSIERLEKERHDDLYVVTAYAKDANGRTDASTGAVSLGSLKGEALANAIMKCETKAKRRVTLSICGLGLLDETEVDSIPGGPLPPAPPSRETVDIKTGEVIVAKAAPEPPKGYDDWMAHLESTADQGMGPLQKAWGDGGERTRPFRQYADQYERTRWSNIKHKAEQVKGGAA